MDVDSLHQLLRELKEAAIAGDWGRYDVISNALDKITKENADVTLGNHNSIVKEEQIDKITKENTSFINGTYKNIVDHGLPPMFFSGFGSPPGFKDQDHLPADLSPDLLPDPFIDGVTRATMSRDNTFKLGIISQTNLSTPRKKA